MFLKIKLIAITLTLMLLTACSTRWVYNQLDWLIPWYLDDYVSINEFQEPEFSAALDDLLHWHRTTQLTLYRQELQAIKASINEPFDNDKFEGHYQAFNGFIEATFNQVGKTFSPLITKMTEQQKIELLENLAEKNAEYAEKNIEIGEQAYRQKTLERIQDFMQDALGELSEQQLDLLNQWAEDKPWMAPDLYQNRLNWQQNLRQVLESNVVDSSAVNSLFTNPQQHWSQGFEAKTALNQQQMQWLIRKLIPTLSESQRQHLLQKLDRYIEDFHYLANTT